MFCKHCFRQLPDRARFCKFCGQPVEASAQSGQAKQGRNGRPQQQPYPQQQGNPPRGGGQQRHAQPQERYPQQNRRQQGYPQQGYQQQGYAQPQQGYQQQGYAQQQANPAAESAPPKKAPSLIAQVKAGVMDIIHHPAKLLPTIILSVIWMVISYLMAMGKDLPAIKWLNTLTYASGGMYGGSLGAAGGIFGKAVFAAVLNTVVLSLWAGKSPFARDANGQSLMTQATSKGMAKVAPFVIGLGASLVLYYFFNVTGSTNNVMVGVMAAIGTIQAAQSSHGIIFSTVLFIIEKVSGGRTPSSSAVRNSLMGATAGFALSVPLTYLHKPLLFATAGFAVLLLGILLAVLGQQKKAGKVAMSVLWVTLSLFALFCPGAEAAVPKPEEISGEYHYYAEDTQPGGGTPMSDSGTSRMILRDSTLYWVTGKGSAPAAYNAQTGTARWTIEGYTLSLRFYKGSDGKVHATGTYTMVYKSGKSDVFSVSATQTRALGGAPAAPADKSKTQKPAGQNKQNPAKPGAKQQKDAGKKADYNDSASQQDAEPDNPEALPESDAAKTAAAVGTGLGGAALGGAAGAAGAAGGAIGGGAGGAAGGAGAAGGGAGGAGGYDGSGYSSSQRGYRREEDGYGPDEGGYGPDEGGYGPEEGGYGPDEGGYGPDEGGYGPEEGGYGPEEGGYGPEEGSGEYDETGGEAGEESGEAGEYEEPGEEYEDAGEEPEDTGEEYEEPGEEYDEAGEEGEETGEESEDAGDNYDEESGEESDDADKDYDETGEDREEARDDYDESERDYDESGEDDNESRDDYEDAASDRDDEDDRAASGDDYHDYDDNREDSGADYDASGEYDEAAEAEGETEPADEVQDEAAENAMSMEEPLDNMSVDDDGSIRLTTPDGETLVYTRNEDGSYNIPTQTESGLDLTELDEEGNARYVEPGQLITKEEIQNGAQWFKEHEEEQRAERAAEDARQQALRDLEAEKDRVWLEKEREKSGQLSQLSKDVMEEERQLAQEYEKEKYLDKMGMKYGTVEDYVTKNKDNIMNAAKREQITNNIKGGEYEGEAAKWDDRIVTAQEVKFVADQSVNAYATLTHNQGFANAYNAATNYTETLTDAYVNNKDMGKAALKATVDTGLDMFSNTLEDKGWHVTGNAFAGAYKQVNENLYEGRDAFEGTDKAAVVGGAMGGLNKTMGKVVEKSQGTVLGTEIGGGAKPKLDFDQNVHTTKPDMDQNIRGPKPDMDAQSNGMRQTTIAERRMGEGLTKTNVPDAPSAKTNVPDTPSAKTNISDAPSAKTNADMETGATKPRTNVDGDAGATKPKANVDGDAGATKPRTNVDGDAATSKPKANIDGDAGATKPRTNVDGDAGATKPKANVDGDAGASKPRANVDGDAGASKPRANVDGDSAASKPRTNVDGDAGTTKPRTNVDGDAGATKPRTNADGDAGATKPRTNADGDAGTTKPRTNADGDAGTTKPRTNVDGDAGTTKPRPDAETGSAKPKPGGTEPRKTTVAERRMGQGEYKTQSSGAEAKMQVNEDVQANRSMNKVRKLNEISRKMDAMEKANPQTYKSDPEYQKLSERFDNQSRIVREDKVAVDRMNALQGETGTNLRKHYNKSDMEYEKKVLQYRNESIAEEYGLKPDQIGDTNVTSNKIEDKLAGGKAGHDTDTSPYVKVNTGEGKNAKVDFTQVDGDHHLARAIYKAEYGHYPRTAAEYDEALKLKQLRDFTNVSTRPSDTHESYRNPDAYVGSGKGEVNRVLEPEKYGTPEKGTGVFNEQTAVHKQGTPLERHHQQYAEAQELRNQLKTDTTLSEADKTAMGKKIADLELQSASNHYESIRTTAKEFNVIKRINDVNIKNGLKDGLSSDAKQIGDWANQVARGKMDPGTYKKLVTEKFGSEENALKIVAKGFRDTNL